MPTLFAVTQLRPRQLATATMEKALRAIVVAEGALNLLEVDLQANLERGFLLNAGQLDEFVKLAGLAQRSLDKLLEAHQGAKALTKARRVRLLEAARKGASRGGVDSSVNDATQGERLIYIRDYVKWRAQRRLLSLKPTEPTFQALSAALDLFVENLTERVPSVPASFEGRRQGLDAKVRQRLLEVIDPNSADNPWKNKHARLRNQLCIRWLLDLGLRRSELLGVRLGDIDLRRNEVTIVRRADDPDEHRQDAPNVKTRGRLLVLGNELAELTRSYVHEQRRRIKGAASHPNLLVATGSGSPLTKSAMAKVFEVLRTKVPELPEELCPHILRHTWNDDFSELMDRQQVPSEKEEKWRRQQMGWSDNSRMPALYTRRHTRRKANEASLAMQAAHYGTKVKT